MIRMNFLATLCVFLFLVGCEGPPQPPARSVADGSRQLTPETVDLTVSDGTTLQGIIKLHTGEVVFVDYWATWCGPCVAGFPHTVETALKYRDKGLFTIAVSFDRLQDEPKVREFLAKHDADFVNLLSKYDGVSQQAAVDFDVEALPQYRLYDRTGKLRKRWEGKPDNIEN